MPNREVWEEKDREARSSNHGASPPSSFSFRMVSDPAMSVLIFFQLIPPD